MDVASFLALEALDKELCLSYADDYVKHIVIHLNHAGKQLRSLIDTGSNLNLISAQVATNAGMKIQQSSTPKIVTLALDNSAPRPIFSGFFFWS